MGGAAGDVGRGAKGVMGDIKHCRSCKWWTGTPMPSKRYPDRRLCECWDGCYKGRARTGKDGCLSWAEADEEVNKGDRV